jgi:outer membrane biosynthesis protein TonB
VAAATAPRLTGGALASVVLHGGLIAAFLLMRGAPSTPQAPVFAVRLIAAPAGERSLGTVQPAPAPTPVAKPAPTPTPPKVAPKTTPIPAAKAKTAPKQTPAVEAPKTEAPPAKAQTQAGGGPVGGKGNDVANIDIPGIEFPYPTYTENIVRQIITQFGTSNLRYTAVIRFVIRRDGSVDPASIQFVERSNRYAFDNKAFGAIEAVANAKLFGPLPGGFREDILPVTFRFSPQLQK